MWKALARARAQGLAIALIALIALFWATAPGFATLYNLTETLRDLSILGIIAIGETFVLIGGGIDLSVGSVMLIAGIVVDDLIRLLGVNAVAAVPIALAVGGIAGLVNGIVITRLRISAFVVTLATLYVFRGIGLSLYRSDVHDLQGALINDDNFLILGQGDLFGAPVSFLILVALLLLASFVLRRTRFGVHLYAVGGNELATRLTRIPVGRVQVTAYLIGGLCSALGGIILASRLQTGAPEAGLGEEFDVIAAVVIGGASLFGGRGTMLGTLIGAGLIAILAKGQTLIGVPSNYQSFTRGAVILIAVVFDVLGRAGPETSRRLGPRFVAQGSSAPRETSFPGDLSEALLVEPQRTAALEAVNLGKSFVEIRAVDHVSFMVQPGEVHAIVGENGAGKSTLIKMFSGVLKPDAGEIRVDGETVVIDSVARGQDLGIAVIYQERAVVPELTVAQNIMLGYEPVTRIPGVIDREALLRRAEDIWSRLGSPAPIGAVVRDLSPSVQQVVDIARALAFQARVVIMDEPTATLTHQETERLFQIIRSLKQRGAAVVYISHDLEEIFAIASRVTVLRDGKLVGTRLVQDVDRPTLIRMMIGRDLDEQARPFINEGGEGILVVRDLRRGTTLQGINLAVREGEIVGVAGLVGSGRSELLRAIFGADRIDGGEMTLFGKPYAPDSPTEASAARVGFVPEDRKREGLIARFSTSQNLSLPSLRLVSNFGFWLNRGRERALSLDMVRRLKIEPPLPRWQVSRLSGGNQQKVVLGKWLARRPKLLLVDEPTHGVDVGAREEIYRVIDDLARRGTGVLVVSSYLPEVLRISDRILVMREGRIVLETPRTAASEELLLHAAADG
ncbi:MAG: ATP-binding cassette domain-containing protein [Hyphomicrobiales bacterium]|nr:ATP-binding cassette domain-containing protein [Hyphomicrobiales bacterium]